MVFWKYFGFVLILFKCSVQILGKESYEVHLEEVTWSEALQNCEKKTSKLVAFDPNPNFHVRIIPSVKREIYPYTNESWVGDYIELVKDQGQRLNAADECVELYVTEISDLNATHYRYEYVLFLATCTKENMIICQDSNNDINISEERESWPGSCQNGKLWTPAFTDLYTAVGGEFDLENYTTFVEGLEVGKTYWTGYCLQKFTSTIPVRQNIYRCGYISLSYHAPAILYDDCNVKRSYVCEHGIRIEKQESSSSTVLYVGLRGSIIVFIIVCVLIVVLCRRKQRIHVQNKMTRQGDTLASLNIPKENQAHQCQQINRGTSNQTCKGTESSEASGKTKETYLTLSADSTYDCIEDSLKYYEIDVFDKEKPLTDSGQNVTRTEQEDYSSEAFHKHNENKSDNEYEPLETTDSTHMYSAIDTGDQYSDSVDQSEEEFEMQSKCFRE